MAKANKQMSEDEPAEGVVSLYHTNTNTNHHHHHITQIFSFGDRFSLSHCPSLFIHRLSILAVHICLPPSEPFPCVLS
jgi:hypothetical protein